MIKYGCPIPNFNQTFEAEDGSLEPVYWIAIPEKWFAAHKMKEEEMGEKLPENLGDTIRSFCVSLGLAEAFNLPGITDNDPDNWDFEKLSLELVTWVNRVVLSSYTMAQIVPKDWLLPWAGGQPESKKKEAPATDGTSENPNLEPPSEAQTS